MDYKGIYERLIDKAIKRDLKFTRGCGLEKHHSIPKCMNGKSSIIVVLEPREHYIAHQLLVKMYPKNKKLVYALQMMTWDAPNNNRSKNRNYDWIKKQISKARLGCVKPSGSGRKKGSTQTDEVKKRLSIIKTGTKHTDETKLKISIAGKNRPPQSEETIAKRVQSNAGFKHTEETKLKQSLLKKGTKQTEAHINSRKETMANKTQEQKAERAAKCAATKLANKLREVA